MPPTSPSVEQIQAVKNKHQAELLRLPNVVSVGVGFCPLRGVMVLMVNVTHKVPRSQLPPEAVIPAEVEGILVDVVALGGPVQACTSE